VKPISELTDDELREDRLINVGNPMAEHLAAEVLRLREQLGSLPQMLRAAEAELADLRAHTAVNRESLARADERWDKVEAELARQKPVIDAALAWKDANRDGFYGRGRMSDDLIAAVDAYREGGNA
jgi:chromosome segregation ATPase